MKMQRYSFMMILMLALVIGLMGLAQGASTAATPAPAGQDASTPATPASSGKGASTTPAPAAPMKTETPATVQPQRGPWASDAPDAGGPTQPVDPDKLQVSVTFVKADIANVLAFLSLASGVPIVLNGEIKGTVTITSVNKVPLTMAYDVINSALRVQGYTMVGTLKDKLVRVEPLKGLADKPSVQKGAKVENIGTSDTIITQVIPLQYLNATRLLGEIRSLVPTDQANLLAENSTNALIMTDSEANVRHIVQLVNLLDVDTANVMDVEVYTCKYANAASLISSISQVFGISANSTQTIQQPMQFMPGRAGGNTGNQPAQPTLTSDQGTMSLQGQLHLSSDDRTNSILISASRPNIILVLGLIKKLDIDTTPEVNPKIFTLRYADATMVANQLTQIFQQAQSSNSNNNNPFFRMFNAPTTSSSSNQYLGLKPNMIVADLRTNSVVVTATEQNMTAFAQVIAALDTQNTLDVVARNYPLKFATAITMAQTLNALFSGNISSMTTSTSLSRPSTNTSTYNGDPLAMLLKITVIGDLKTNSLLVTAPPQAFPMIESLISKLDQRSNQVYIEVKVLDVTLGLTDQFGIEWNLASGSTNGGTNYGLQSGATKTATNGMPVGFKYSVVSKGLSAFLQGLATRSDVKVISSPTITTADNVKATLTIGENVPYLSSSSMSDTGTVTQGVTYQAVNMSLVVTPHVNISSDLIGLDIDQKIDEMLGNVTSAMNAPLIANREAQTSVMVNDGQTLVIGGIMKEDVQKTRNSPSWLTKIPVLNLITKVPLVNNLFISETRSNTRSELMVFLTPHILRDDVTANVAKNTHVTVAEETLKAQQQITLPDDDDAPKKK